MHVLWPHRWNPPIELITVGLFWTWWRIRTHRARVNSPQAYSDSDPDLQPTFSPLFLFYFTSYIILLFLTLALTLTLTLSFPSLHWFMYTPFWNPLSWLTQTQIFSIYATNNAWSESRPLLPPRSGNICGVSKVHRAASAQLEAKNNKWNQLY